MDPSDERLIRLSDADRQQAVQRLNDALSEGRLTLPEFEERVAAALAARTTSDLEPHLADLPATTPATPPTGEIKTTAASVKRAGRWLVARRLTIRNKAGSVKLDLTEAVLPGPVVDVVLETVGGSVQIVVPQGASANLDDVELVASTAKAKVPTEPVPGGGPHLVVTGKQTAGSVLVRHQRRFLRWRW